LVNEQTVFPRIERRTDFHRRERLHVTRIGVISAYPDEDWDAQRIWEAAARRGEATLLGPTDFSARIGPRVTTITASGRESRDFDLFLTPRAVGDQGDAELQLELYRTLEETGSVLVNSVGAMTTAIDKFKSSWLFARAGLPTPRVRVAQRLDEALAALAELGDVVVKPVFGSLGLGIERLSSRDSGRLRTLLDESGALYLQEFVGGVERDVRAFVVGERVEAAVARRPAAGDFRGNLSQGASAEPIELPVAAARIAVCASRLVGLDYSGVDLLLTQNGVQLLEVNGAPSFRGIHRATGRDMAEAIVEHALERSRKARAA
jgi:tetrahydromethanopterin:alpha-L-glutamate ligase